MPPTMANGKICYIEMPAVDIATFGRTSTQSVWLAHPHRAADRKHTQIRRRRVGEVSGTWSADVRRRSPGLVVYIMVDDARARRSPLIVANGGQVVQAIGADAPEITARFKDPGGNIIGLYQATGVTLIANCRA